MYKLNKRNIKRDEKAKEYIEKTKKALLEAKDSMLPEKTAKDHKNELIMQIFKEEDDDQDASAEFYNHPRPQLTMKQIQVRVQAREQSH